VVGGGTTRGLDGGDLGGAHRGLGDNHWQHHAARRSSGKNRPRGHFRTISDHTGGYQWAVGLLRGCRSRTRRLASRVLYPGLNFRHAAGYSGREIDVPIVGHHDVVFDAHTNAAPLRRNGQIVGLEI